MSGSEHWIYQGRQEHGWFGHGTGPGSDVDGNGLFDPANAADRVDYVAASLIGHVPREERARWAASVGEAAIGRLKTAVAAWYGASRLSPEAFQAVLLDPYATERTVERLRSAARKIIEAQTHEDLARAGGDLAVAARQIGPDRWPRFLADAKQRAVAAVASGQVPGVTNASATGTDAGPAIVLGGLALLYLLSRRGMGRSGTRSFPERSTTFQNAPSNEEPAGSVPEAGLAKPGEATLTEERRKYIFNGDGKGHGGHGTGRNIPGKSEFPSYWSDDEAAEAIIEVANDPESTRSQTGRDRTKVNGTKNGVDIEIIVGGDGKTIVTAYPTNTKRNPE